jgi:hypothetical protein
VRAAEYQQEVTRLLLRKMSLNKDLSIGNRVKLNMHVAKSLYRMVQKSFDSRGNIEHRVVMIFAPH